MRNFVQKFCRRFWGRSAQTLFEYAIIIAAVSIVVILVLRGIGQYPPKAMAPVSENLN